MKNQDQSKPKLNLKILIKKVTFRSLIVLLLVGGGYEGPEWSLKTDGVPGIIRAVAELFQKKEGRDDVGLASVRSEVAPEDV